MIHLTARESNPFYFSLMIEATRVSLGILFLVWSREKYLNAFFKKAAGAGTAAASGTKPPQLTSIATHIRGFVSSARDDERRRINIEPLLIRSPASWLKVPLVWAGAGALTYGFLAWSTYFVETAVATTAYELWPLVTIVALARHEHSEALYVDPSAELPNKKISLSPEQLALSALAAVGLLFMLSSQSGEEIHSIREIFSFEGVFGISLALVGAVLSGTLAAGTLIYGKILYYSVVDETKEQGERYSVPVGKRGPDDRRLLLWLTMLGVSLSGIISLPLMVVLALGIRDSDAGMTTSGFVGSMLIGLFSISGAVLLRIGNIGTAGPGVNALFFLSPILAVAALMVLKVTLPRFDLFIIGAALIIAINILLQLKPDAERDYSKFGKETLPGARLGFVAFILSIWIFGTAVYLRDEVFPDRWLSWSANDYWGLIALSATVFALILGFRVARLTTRISREDDLMLSIFRDGEHLRRREILTEETEKKLSDLDTAQPNELLSIYNSLRTMIREAHRLAKTKEDEQSLLSVEKHIDQLTHSKQQGRDIVELLSLTAFAAVTVGLGLLARPDGLDSPNAEWSGFLSEVFILLFVSTVAFLCVNLFDIRRERETPLLVSVEQQDGDHGLFFRHKQNLKVQHATSIAISGAMSVTFCFLLYDKWL